MASFTEPSSTILPPSTGSFAQRQDALQQVLARCSTFEELRSRLQNYYRELLPDVYNTASRKGTAEIFRVQQYIREHYHEDLSLKTLAEVACVSPHYFSAYFKAETGQNYNVRRFVDSFRAVYHLSPSDYRKLHKASN